MGTLSLSLPTIGQPNATEDPDIVSDFTGVQSEYNSNIANILGAWKPLYQASGIIPGNFGGATIAFHQFGLHATGGSFGGVPPAGQMQYFDPADFAISGYTTKIRLVGAVVTNATAPGCNYTMGWHQCSAGGGGSGIMTVGISAASVSIAVNTPAASSVTSFTSSAITMPSASNYVACATESGPISANNSTQAFVIQVEYRHV